MYEEQQVEGDSNFERVLRAQEKVYLARKTAGLSQGTLRNWLSNTNLARDLSGYNENLYITYIRSTFTGSL